MAQIQTTFKRYEKKYLLTPAQYSALSKVLKKNAVPDQYGLSTISSLYLDTDDYRLVRSSIEKPVYKEKIRLRSYGTPFADDPVFLELKKKYKGVVYKRRITLPLKEAEAYLNQGIAPTEAGQIFQEIDWAMKFYTPKPKALIAYDRLAMTGKEDPALRITLDHRIRWRNTELSLAEGSWGSEILPEGSVLMEVKIAGAMPLWLAHMLQIPGTDSSQNTLAVTYSSVQAAGTLLTLSDSDGSSLLSVNPAKEYQAVIISTPELKQGESYTLYTGGSVSGKTSDTLTLKGTYTAGTKVVTVPLSGVATSVDDSGNEVTTNAMGGMGGGMRGGKDGGTPPELPDGASMPEGMTPPDGTTPPELPDKGTMPERPNGQRKQKSDSTTSSSDTGVNA